MVRIVLIVLFLMLPSLAVADIYNGNMLLEDCNESMKTLDNTSKQVSFLNAGTCAGFVLAMLEASPTLAPEKLCLPRDVKVGQAIRVVVKFLKDHPEKLHEVSSELVLNAFLQVFPCK